MTPAQRSRRSAPCTAALWFALFFLMAVPALARAQRHSVWLGAGLLPMERTAAFGSDVGTRSASGRAFDVTWRATWGGVMLRVLDADFGTGGATNAAASVAGAGQVALGDVRVLLGPRAATADVGVMRRAFTGGLGTVAASALRVGGRSEVPVGGSGVTLGIAAAVYAGGPELRGREAESWVSWSPPRGAWWGVRAGYRGERASGRNDRVEELHGWTMGLMLRVR
jgi:hypothetical protein